MICQETIVTIRLFFIVEVSSLPPSGPTASAAAMPRLTRGVGS